MVLDCLLRDVCGLKCIAYWPEPWIGETLLLELEFLYSFSSFISSFLPFFSEAERVKTGRGHYSVQPDLNITSSISMGDP